MSTLIPPASNYPSPLVSLPDYWDQIPPEGKRQIPLSIAWATMGGSSKCLSINLANNATLNITQLRAVTVDNSLCGADVIFIMPDTNQTVTVPAYESGTFPLFTNATAIFISSPNAQSVDNTNVILHNTLPPPADVPKSEFQNVANPAAISAIVTSTTQLIPAGVTGTVEFLTLSLAVGSTAAASINYLIEDGNSNTIASAAYVAAGANNFNGPLFTLSDMQVRFINGVKVVQTVTAAPSAGLALFNLLYRTP